MASILWRIIMNEIKSTAVIGMGALGMLFANQITTSLGQNAVSFIADSDRLEKYRHMNFSVNGIPCKFQLTDSHEASPADLVIVAVKYNALPSAIDTMKQCIGSNTIIISVMNGINSEEIIGKRYGHEKLIYTIAQGMDAVKFGGDLNYSMPGELRIGIRGPASDGSIQSASQEDLNNLVNFLKKTGIHFTIENDIIYRLWSKFMLNVGINQVCMAFETNYGGAIMEGEPFDTMVGAMKEVILIANAEGIPLRQSEIDNYIKLTKTLSPNGMPSMRQDAISHRLSEVEMFSGTVKKIAAKHNIPVPVNNWLYRKIKNIEASYPSNL